MDRAAMTVGVTGELNDITVLELTAGGQCSNHPPGSAAAVQAGRRSKLVQVR
jgi:hypothetical protein